MQRPRLDSGIGKSRKDPARRSEGGHDALGRLQSAECRMQHDPILHSALCTLHCPPSALCILYSFTRGDLPEEDGTEIRHLLAGVDTPTYSIRTSFDAG